MDGAGVILDKIGLDFERTLQQRKKNTSPDAIPEIHETQTHREAQVTNPIEERFLEIFPSEADERKTLRIALGFFLVGRGTDANVKFLALHLGLTNDNVRKMLTLAEHSFLDKIEEDRVYATGGCVIG